jgi:uncharacterized protein YciI
MQFVMIGHDKPGGLETRKATRAAHLEYLSEFGGVVFAGPLLGADGNPFGSLVVIEAADEAAARLVFENDPYVKADLFEMVSVSGFRQVFDKGALLG